ncbi:hypothetical protein BH24CHL6_BH24CHL6_15810 [soil metagenome]
MVVFPKEDAEPRARSGTISRWLQLVGVGLLTVALMSAVIVWGGSGNWHVSLALGVIGALAVGRAWTGSNAALSRVPLPEAAGWAALHAELARSRRHNRPFVLLGIPERVWSPADAEGAEREVAGVAAGLSLQGLLRTPDHTWADESVLYVLLTDCDISQAEAFLQRVRISMPQLFPSDQVRVSAFPDDGLTVGALLYQLRHEPSLERSVDGAA